MIRVIYRWTVDPAKESELAEAWRAATQRIRDQEPGAMGSTLLRPADSPNMLVGRACRQRGADVEAFWASGNANPLPGGTVESVEVLEEVEHTTLERRTATETQAG